MAQHTITERVELVTETCCKCHMVFAMPRSFYDQLQATKLKGSFYCPAGHGQHYTGDSEETKLRRERDRLKQDAARLEESIKWERQAKERARAEAKHERSRANGYKGFATKQANRVKGGVCPCCNRTFAALGRHMASEHPDYAAPELGDGAPVAAPREDTAAASG